MKKRKKRERLWAAMRKVRRMEAKVKDLRTKRKRSAMRKRVVREVVVTRKLKRRKALPR